MANLRLDGDGVTRALSESSSEINRLKIPAALDSTMLRKRVQITNRVFGAGRTRCGRPTTVTFAIFWFILSCDQAVGVIQCLLGTPDRPLRLHRFKFTMVARLAG